MIRMPAGSALFLPEALHTIDLVAPIDNITWEQACGGSTGKGVKVAVIDSGIEASHPALKGPVHGYVSIQEGPDGLIYNTEPHADEHGHGTACAGIIHSIAPDCELYSVKVLGEWLMGRGPVFAAGLRWAIENGMHVCNLSLGTTKKEFFTVFHELADLAYFRGVVLVTAANNLPVPSFPSVYASVISVASHKEPDAYHFYYNPEPPIEFGALGIDVRVPWRDGQWITATGNSFAAPHMTGIVTKIVGKYPTLTPFQVKTILRALSANTTRANLKIEEL
ncbi:MAG: S8 family serine peptidase [Chloroflexota bacterium]|nr:S8 family serine peptidase [Chloroflexota bacterium]